MAFVRVFRLIRTFLRVYDVVEVIWKKEKGVVGFIYVADSDQGILKNAKVGQTIKNQKKAHPWIVVDHGFEKMIIAKWPGTLWRAEVEDEAKNTGLLDYAKYTRANAVKIIERLSLAILFGNFGSGVLKVIESSQSVDVEIAKRKCLEIYSLCCTRH